MGSAAGKPLPAHEAAGAQGRFIVMELVDDAIGELCGNVDHEAGDGSVDEEQEKRDSIRALRSISLLPSDGRFC
jgi:hypothetical protein